MLHDFINYSYSYSVVFKRISFSDRTLETHCNGNTMVNAYCSWLVCACFGCVMSGTLFINNNEKVTSHIARVFIAGKRQFVYCLALGWFN